MVAEPAVDVFLEGRRRQELVNEKLQQVFEQLKQDRVEGPLGRWKPPVGVAQALATARDRLEELVEGEGFEELAPVLEGFRERLGRLGRTTRAELVRKMLLPGTSDEQAGEIARDLAGLLDPVEVARLRALLGVA
jgi:hypothetical protein